MDAGGCVRARRRDRAPLLQPHSRSDVSGGREGEGRRGRNRARARARAPARGKAEEAASRLGSFSVPVPVPLPVPDVFLPCLLPCPVSAFPPRFDALGEVVTW